MFVSVYPEFYTKLNAITELSTTDLRLATYIKMNHTNSEIAIISGVSSRTIESQQGSFAARRDSRLDGGRGKRRRGNPVAAGERTREHSSGWRSQ